MTEESQPDVVTRTKLLDSPLVVRDRASSALPATGFQNRSSTKCQTCGKTVYEQEKLVVGEGLVYHKIGCFKCAHCNGNLKLGSFAALEGKYYCKPHFKQLFALKGNYAGGFGAETPIEKWNREKGCDTNESPSPMRHDEENDRSIPSIATEHKSEQERTPVPEKERPPPQIQIADCSETKTEASDSTAQPKNISAIAESGIRSTSAPRNLDDLKSRASTFGGTAVSPLVPRGDKCHTCGKTVYQQERLQCDGLVFHKLGCFKCEECKCTLSLGKYASLEGKYYCKPHFKQLFALKGNYAGGFGNETPIEKWNREQATSANKPPE